MMRMKKEDLVLPELSYKVNGLLFEVHNELGRFCREKQYADLLESKLKSKGVSYKREKNFMFKTSGMSIGGNKADFVVEEKILIELKAKSLLTRDDYYQVLRYLSASNLKLGLLVNFRNKYLHPKRVLNSQVI